MLDMILSADRAILLFLQNFVRMPALNAVMIFLTKLGDKGAVWLAFGIALCFVKKYRKSGIYIVSSIAFCFIINNLILKNLVMRPRPYDEIPALVPLVPKLFDSSFPSGHSCASFAAAYAISHEFRGYGILSYIPAVLISLSRLYVGVHYPTDVIVGALTGFFGSLLFFEVIVPRIEKLKHKGQ